MVKSVVYVGMDVHKDSITIAVAHEGREPAQKWKTIPYDGIRLQKALKMLVKPSQVLKVCYEAGPTGFGLHRRLRKAGIDCVVDRQTALNQYIRLLDAKLRVGNFLLRLRELRLRERKFEQSTPQSTPHTPCVKQSTPHTPCAAMPLQPGLPFSEPASLSCKNEDLPTKKEPTESHPAAETWKNNQKAPKNPSLELAPQDPSPKTQDHEVEVTGRGRGRPGSLLATEDQPCKNEDLPTKKEPADSHSAAETWKNNQSTPHTPCAAMPLQPGSPLPEPEPLLCKNKDLLTKNEPEEFEDLEGKRMYANYLARFPEARSAPIIPDPRKKQGPKPSPYYSPK